MFAASSIQEELEKVFLRKNIVADSFFQNCAVHPNL